MLDFVREAVAANQADAAAYSEGVRLWMAVMAASFLSSIVFVFWKAGARWILLAALVNIAGLILLRVAFPDLDRTVIGTLLHLVFWTPAVYLVWRPAMRARRQLDFAGAWGALHRVWLVAASLVMATSLLLDARTAVSWL